MSRSNKTYIYTTSIKKISKMYGYKVLELTIYRVKNNLPIFVGRTDMSTNATRGETSEVFNALIKLGEVPKSYYNLSRSEISGGGYYCDEVAAKGIIIKGV